MYKADVARVKSSQLDDWLIEAQADGWEILSISADTFIKLTPDQSSLTSSEILRATTLLVLRRKKA